MRFVPAAQVVYGNVEVDQSPHNRRGFQVLFRSFSRLTEDDVTRDIEPRLFFVSENQQSPKYCFYTIPDGRAVVARCVQVTGTDQFSRKGLHLAHALVFSKEDFREFDNNPFQVFDQFQFFNSFEEARAAASGGAGDIHLARVSSLAPYRRDTTCPISREQFLSLLILAYRFTCSQNQEGTIGFYGQGDKMLNILRSLFYLLPIRLRTKCTFDTFFVEGRLGRMPYWAVGFPENQSRDSRLYQFELERESFGVSIDVQPKTAFESWLTWMFAPPLSDLSKQVDEALYVSELIDGKRLRGGVSEQANAKQLLIGFQPFLEGRLRERLRTQIGEELCERAFPQALAWLGRQGLAALTPIAESISAQQVEQWLSDAYLTSYEKPLPSEIQAIERFSSRNQRSILPLIYLRWTNQWSPLRSALRSADTEITRGFTKWALASVQAFVRPGAQPGTLLSLGLYAEGDALLEAANLLGALLDRSPEEILSTSSAEGTGQTSQIPIEQLISLYALIVERH